MFGGETLLAEAAGNQAAQGGFSRAHYAFDDDEACIKHQASFSLPNR